MAAPPAAGSAGSVRLYKFVYDHRYASARAFGVAAEHAGSSAGMAAIAGDITALWSRDLKARWCAGDGAIAGMTTARTLFCLEQLAKDHRLRVAVRAEHSIAKGQKIAHRLTAPEPMIARMGWALGAEDWATMLPAALATCRDVDDAHLTRLIESTRTAMTDETLVSFVIA